ncbi:hypothetical protein LRB_752 [Ligilactobacillus ruminis]|uniref:Uncharacterized protein n=1 Tax=Ligilactobacillus ruminis TaxID=1623 RepID=A0A837ITJ9_9LACO|nr:hypothetical protein LRB_752 [Ligilactobacillus ruminis]
MISSKKGPGMKVPGPFFLWKAGNLWDILPEGRNMMFPDSKYKHEITFF